LFLDPPEPERITIGAGPDCCALVCFCEATSAAVGFAPGFGALGAVVVLLEAGAADLPGSVFASLS
jgi:hypothetical protein